LNLLIRLGDGLRGLAGWQRFICAMVLGAFSATAFAPIGFFPALLLGFAGLALLLDGAAEAPHRWRAAAATGWAFAFGQFLTGMHWIVYPFMVDPAQHLWQLPFALTLLPAGLGLFGALGVLPAMLVRGAGAARLLLLAAGYGGAEWLRGHVLTGFPWNLPAYGWGASLAVMQGAALIGAYGLSLLTILLGVSLAELLPGEGARRRLLLPGLMLLLFAGLWGWGALRLATPSLTVPGVSLRLVQPDVPQREMGGAYRARNWQRLMDLSKSPGHPTHIIWPEAAAGDALARTPDAMNDIARLTSQGSVLMTGAMRIGAVTRQRIVWFNSLYLFEPGGALLGVYDKTHLVPFGEYVPYPRLMNALGIAQLTGLVPATAGNGLHRYAVPGAPPLTPLICYEDTFPGEVLSPEGRPGWFVNVTDDSWFGPWAGPAQHLLTAQMRTIEEGVPMARAANTGISAVIDAKGRIIGKRGLNQMGVLDMALPAAENPTLFETLGNLGFFVLLIFMMVSAALAARRT